MRVCVSKAKGDIKALIDNFKNAYEKGVCVLFELKEDKILIAAGVKNVSLKAGILVKEIATLLGGSGGGRDDFATAGGKDVNKLDEALNLAKELILKAL